MRQRNKVCGIDVHKRMLVATILDSSGNSDTRKYSNGNLSDLATLRTWLVDEGCEAVGFESTGSYWYKLYEGLSPYFPVEVANAYHIRHIPGKKTDELDSHWIAQLCLNNQITASRIFQGDERDLRSLTRYRETLVEGRTVAKNKVHHILDSSNITLSNHLTDLFGKSGMMILQSIVSGENIDSVISRLPPRIQKKSDAIRGSVSQSLGQTDLRILRSSLQIIQLYTVEIESIEQEIFYRVQENHLREFEILRSFPGIGNIAAAIMIAEIGDIKSFPSGNKLAAWAGIVPAVYMSANRNFTGSITKHGNSHLRWIVVEVAHGCVKKTNSALKEIFEKMRRRIGYKKAIVALARKILTIVWHLLTNNELYEEEGIVRTGGDTIRRFINSAEKIGFEEALILI